MSDPCAKGGILAEKRPRITWFESLQSASSELPALKKGTSGGMTQKLEEATLASAEKIAQEMLENQAEGHTSSSVNTILHTLNLFPEKSGVLQLAKKVGKLKGKGAGSLALPELRALLSKYPEKPQDHDVSNIDECLGKFKVEHLLEALNKCRDQQVLDETKLKAQQALHLHFKLVKAIFQPFCVTCLARACVNISLCVDITLSLSIYLYDIFYVLCAFAFYVMLCNSCLG